MGIILAAVETAGKDNCLKDRLPGLTRRSITPRPLESFERPLPEYSGSP
jgi:hypothetical protein